MNKKELKKWLAEAPEDADILEILPMMEKVITVSSDTPSEMIIEDGRYPTFRHSVNVGDLIAAMGSLKKYFDITKRKTIVCQTLDVPGQYYPGAVHPVKDNNGVQVTCNKFMFDMIKPLIESQYYIQECQINNGQHIDWDFDVIRGKINVNLPHGPIQGWIPLAFPDLSYDISQPWMFLDDNIPVHIKSQVKGKIILNFTERYRDPLIEYHFLKPYSGDLIFAGTEREHWLFSNKWNLTIPRLEVNNFLDLAYALKCARFSISNQSMMWNLAQALGTKRILEMYRHADNCFPNIGAWSEGYFYEVGAKYYFTEFYNKIQ